MFTRIFRVFFDFPDLAALIKLGNRVMDFMEGRQQSEIDALTSRIKTNTAKLKAAIEGEK